MYFPAMTWGSLLELKLDRRLHEPEEELEPSYDSTYLYGESKRDKNLLMLMLFVQL